MSTGPALCPLPLWLSLFQQDPSATFFQSPAWHHLAAAHYSEGRRTEPAPLLFDMPGGPACLPLLRDRRWGRPRYFSPFGAYAALLCARELDAAERARISAQLATLNLQLISSPFTPNLVGAGVAQPSRTQVVDLTPAHAEAPEQTWDPDPRRKLRMARENGVRVRVANSSQDWDDYYGLYLKSLERWGARSARGATSTYPRPLFDALQRLSREDEGAVRLWLSEHEGNVAGGYIAFYHNAHACIWHGAADQEYFKLGATQLLYHDMIADAARRRFPIFDLMGSSGLQRLEAFKASLGARTVEYASWLNRTGLIGTLARLKSRGR